MYAASAIAPDAWFPVDTGLFRSARSLDFLAAGGVNGVCLLEAAGEFLDYTFPERQRLVYLGVKRSRVPVMVGVSHSTLAGSIELAGEAIASGADALILMPQYFFRYSQREIEEFYVEFARETGDAVPLLIHNLPQATSKLELDLMRKLIDTGRFAGVVDSSGADSSGDCPFLDQLLDLRQTRPFALFNGDDRTALRALRAGANGLISSSACAVPELLAGLTRTQDDRLQARLNDFLDWAEKFPFPTAIKRAVELRGQKSAPPLTPLAPETRQALAEFSTWFTGWVKDA